MLRYPPILSLASPESIVHSCSIGGGLGVDLVFPLEWPPWISQHFFFLSFSITKHKTQIQDFTLSFYFCKITFTHLNFPSLRRRPWNTFQVKHRLTKDSLRLGSTFVHHTLISSPFIPHFHHSVALSLASFRGRVTLPHSYKPYTHWGWC